MKSILEFCLSPDLGGLELFMVNCYQNFKTKTNTKIVIEQGEKIDNYFEDEDKFYIKRNKFFPIIPAKKLAKFVDENDIDVIHFHWTRDIATVVLARVLSRKKPQIIQTRNMSMTRFKDDFYHRWLYKNINTMHAVTYQVKEQLEKFIPSDIRPRVEVVYMGTKEKHIEETKLLSLKEKYALKDEFLVGIVGRIEEGKGQYLVLEAVAKLKHLNLKAMVVGDTMDKEYLQELKQKVEDLNIKDRVIFTGFTKEVDAHMQLFDANVLATPRETFGLVVIEAMVNRVCMIATNKAGPLEIIDDGINGLLFDRTSEDLAKKIKMLYDDRDFAQSLSLAGYEKAKNRFDKNIQNKKLFDVISKIEL